MLKTIRKVFLSCLSILGISLLFWICLFLNPSWSYAHETAFDYVTVYHNQELDEQVELRIKDAINIIKKSDLFYEGVSIQLCMNDDEWYPSLHPFAGGPLAFAVYDKTIIKNCTPNFEENVVEAQWEVNNNEFRRFDLTRLLAHEFTHNLQHLKNTTYTSLNTLTKINWKLEGHAEYIAREYQNDGRLKEKIAWYLLEVQKEHNGIPVFELEDGTKQSLGYFKYALVVQYLMEEKALDFFQICELEVDFESQFDEMVNWSKKSNENE